MSELYHHGTKGQKWGLRRFQNPDGSLTAEGRLRYGYGDPRSKIKMIREQGRSERRIARAQNAERIKYERQQSKLDAKLKKVHDNELERTKNQERKQLAKLKKEKPLQYAKLKKYIGKDGTLNEAGRARYFTNGQKKTASQMSNKELRDAKYRYEAEQNYKYIANKAKQGKLSNRIANSILKSGVTFAAVYGGRRALNSITKGKVYKDSSDSLKAALAAMSSVFLGNLGIQGIKTGDPFKEYKDKNGKGKNNERNRNQLDLSKYDYIDNEGYRQYMDEDGKIVGTVPLDVLRRR